MGGRRSTTIGAGAIALSLAVATPGGAVASPRPPGGGASSTALCAPVAVPICVGTDLRVDPPEVPDVPDVDDSPCVAAPSVRERCEAWASRYDFEGSFDEGYEVVVTPDGSTAVVTGKSWPAEGRLDFAVRAYDVATGTERWTVRHDFGVGMDDVGYAIAMSPDGRRVFVSGTGRPTDLSLDAVTLAVDVDDGEVAWEATFNGPRHDSPDVLSDVVVSRDGTRVYATGFSYGGRNTSLDYLTIAYDADTGDELWSVRRTEGGGVDQALSIEESADGKMVAVTGFEARPDLTADALTVAYGADDGVSLWEHRYDPHGGLDWGTSIAAAPGEAVFYVSALSHAPETYLDYAVEAIDATTGETIWTARHAGDGGDGADLAGDVPYAVEATADRVIVTGYGFGPVADQPAAVAPEYLTVGLDAATGQEVWVRPYEGLGPAGDGATDVAISADGETAYVTGWSQTVPETGMNFAIPGSGVDLVTVAYSVHAGTVEWTSRYEAGFHDYARSAAALPDGVVVAGTSFTADQNLTADVNYDYATVRYVT